jgi:tetratricopeptide (TPR) repeat protein
MRRTLTLMLICLISATAGNACMWDRDTLAVEAKGHLDYVAAVIGRFERNPPMYYQMRLDRVREELRHDPTRIDLYDDAGVAAARLGKFDEAIQWMAKKKAAMKPLNMKDQTSRDEWYRYYSNLGTFVSYDVFVKSKAPDHLARLKRAVALLNSGLEINPNAHFGREKFQLFLVEWALKVNTEKDPNSLAGIVLNDDPVGKRVENAIQGYVGLIQLGAAWNSVDVLRTLRDAQSYKENSYLAQLAEFRAEELLRDGAKPLVAEKSFDGGPLYPDFMPEREQTAPNLAEYKRLRKEAEEIRARRDEFMIAKMQQGKHPDTDTDFWVGYSGPDPIDIQPVSFWQTEYGSYYMTALRTLSPCFIAILAPIAFFWIRARRRKLRQAP